MRHVKHSHFLQSTAVHFVRFAAMPDAETLSSLLRCTSSSLGDGSRRVKPRPKSCCSHAEYPAASRLLGLIRAKAAVISSGTGGGRRDGRHRGRMGDGEVEVVDGEDEAAEEEAADVIQPLQLQAITRKCRSHTDINNAKSRRLSTPQPIKSRSADQNPPTTTQKSSSSSSLASVRKRILRKAKSAPDLSCSSSINNTDYVIHQPKKRTSFQASSEEAGDLAVTSGKLSPLDDYDDDSAPGNIAVSRAINTACRKAILGQIFDQSHPTQAEALWDHVTLDALELRFGAGDVIEVMDMLDKDWWWGKIADREGWFPSAFVTLRKRQSYDCFDGVQDTEVTSSDQSRQESLERMNHARSNVIQDILSSERDYVKHLKDVIEGYVEKARRRTEMFSDECISTIFGNIEQIFQFASTFLQDLEKNLRTEDPHRSEIGNCFLDLETEFQIYSEYCNNHPFACEELHRLQQEKKYQHFFEACRLLQQMIEIPLEGFLLTPVQKICKYPLQLKELLKYTQLEHPDYSNLQRALEMMKKTAMLINERKRKMESLEKLAQWQKTVAYWQGPSLLENSSELIYSGETNKVSTSGSHRLRIIFLFDHQLIFCKKDILWRELFVFKGRIFMDNCTVYAIQDCKDTLQLKHGFRIHDRINDLWYTFSCRSPADEERWLRAFHEERQRVDFDRDNGFDLRKFKEKAFCSQLKLRQLYPSSRTKDKNQLRKKASYLSSDEMSPSSLSPSGPPQPKKGFLGFMQRRYRR